MVKLNKQALRESLTHQILRSANCDVNALASDLMYLAVDITGEAFNIEEKL